MLREYNKFKSKDGCIGVDIKNYGHPLPPWSDQVMLILKDGEKYYCPFCNYKGKEVEVIKGSGGCPVCDGAFYWKLRVFSPNGEHRDCLGRKIVLEDTKETG